MTNDLIRGDVNWFDRRCSQRRSAGVAGRRSRVATAQDERRRSITLGSMMTFASLAAQPNPRWSCRPKTEDFSLAPRAASLDRCRSRIRLGLAVYSRMPYLKREVSGSQCGAGNVRIVDYFGVCACSGVLCQPRTGLLVNLHFIPFHRFAKAIRIDSTFDVLEEIAACSNDRPFTTAARPNRSRLIRKRLRSGTNASALRGCRRRTGG